MQNLSLTKNYSMVIGQRSDKRKQTAPLQSSQKIKFEQISIFSASPEKKTNPYRI